MADSTHAFTVRTADEIRESSLRTLRNGLNEVGIDANVTPGSDDYVRFNAIANELAVCEANGAAKADELMPDTATGEGLQRWLDVSGVELRPAQGSIGTIIFDASQSAPVALGLRLVDTTGQLFEVYTGATYDDGDEIPVVAISTGDSTNLPGGTVLRWVTPPPFAASTAVVSDEGFVNGTDEDSEDDARARMLAVFQDPPASGNPSHVAKIAEDSTATVQKAFVYPAAQGAGTYHVAVISKPTATNKERTVSDAKMNTIVRPYVVGQLGEHVEGTITSCESVETSVAIQLSIASSPNASPPGPGGGWVDGTPWPPTECHVSDVTSSTEFVVEIFSPQATENITRISWLSTVDWKVKTATVLTCDTNVDGLLITIDTPFAGIEVGDRIWPACENQDAYAAAVLEGFAAMGPGEKSDNPYVLQRAYRHPIPAQSFPYELGAQTLSKLTKLTDVYSAEFIQRDDGTTTLDGPSGSFAPEVPATITDPPKIFVPKRIGFYPSAE